MIVRLKRRSDFLRVARADQKWVTPGLILQVGSHAETESRADTPSRRIGFTVSRKVGNAVERNRAKRRLRAVADDLLARHGADGYDYVVIGRRATLTRPFKALQNDMLKALNKLGVYQETAPRDEKDCA